MSTEANSALVRRFYALMSDLDFDAAFALLAEYATWTVAGNPDLFHHAGIATKSERQLALGDFTKAFASLEQMVVSTTAEQDRVVAEMRARCVTHDGLIYENELLTLLRCRDGRIVSIYEHLDQATTLEFEGRMAAVLSGAVAH